MNYELYNYITVRPFKNVKFLHDEHYDEIHYENSTNWITLKHDELKWFWPETNLHNQYKKLDYFKISKGQSRIDQSSQEPANSKVIFILNGNIHFSM